jgi:hypothetical protein
MSNFKKKAVSVGLTLTTAVWLSGAAAIVPIASAQTAAELTAQINSLLALIQQLQGQIATLQGGGTVSGGTSVACNFTRNLTMGSKGDDVKCLQQYLNAAGYQVAASGPGSPGSETTYFGSLTKSAAIKWQDANAAAVLAPVGLSAGTGFWGSSSRSHYSTIAASTPTPGTGTGTGTTLPPVGVVIPADGIAISLAADNPGNQTVPKAASSVKVLKFHVAGTGTLTNLTFKREGIGATGDFASAGIYLYEGGTRLTSGKTLNSTTHEASFSNLGIELNNNIRTLTLTVDVAGGATASNVNRFRLVSSAGTPTPSGTVTSGNLTIGGQRVGGLDPSGGAAPANPKVGQKEAILQEFKLTASSTEDVMLNRIALIETGSIGNTNLSNFALKEVGSGNTLATANSINAKDLVSFVLGTPFKIEKGQVKTFQIIGDISGSTRRNDTIIFRFDEASDIEATGATYGFPVLPTIAALDADSEADTLTVQGGQVTLSFNGPIAGDIPTRAQDLTVYDFTIASENNIEIRNLRFNVSTTNLTSGDGFNDMKVWDIESNSVVTSAVDITVTSTQQVYTDTISIKAGESKRYKVTVDVDADNETSDTITVNLGNFGASDIKNLDNNQFVNTADIVPNSAPNALSGNQQTVKTASLDVQLAATPASETYVKGSIDKPFVGASFRAIGDNITLKTVKFTASATTGTLGSGESTSFAIYDGTTLISSSYTFSGTVAPYTITFANLNYKINNGNTKVITLRGSLASDASNNDVYYYYINSITDTDVVATDSDGNTLASTAITGTTANTNNAVQITVANVGNVTVTRAPDDIESKAGIIVAGSETVLAKYRFETTNENMIVNKMHLVLATGTVATTTNNVADTIPTLKLYDGTTLLGTYSVNNSGASSGVAIVNGLNWTVEKDKVKTLTVKGVLASISACTATGCTGGDTGEEVIAHFSNTGFEAQGTAAKDTTPATSAVAGREKIVYKTKPTLSALSHSYQLSGAGSAIPAFKFRVAADAKGQVNWKKLQFKVSMLNATMSAASAGNITLYDLTNGTTQVTLATVYSASAEGGTGTATITGGNTGYVSIQLTTEEEVSAGSSKDYELRLTFANLNTTSGAIPRATINMHRQETTVSNASTYAAVSGTVTDTQVDTDSNPSFIWSDFSANSHATSTHDWHNGRYVETFDTPITLQ